MAWSWDLRELGILPVHEGPEPPDTTHYFIFLELDKMGQGISCWLEECGGLPVAPLCGAERHHTSLGNHLTMIFPDTLSQQYQLFEKSVLKCVSWGSLGGSVVKRLPLAQGMILETWDQVPQWAPCMEPAFPSACHSLSLCLS